MRKPGDVKRVSDRCLLPCLSAYKESGLPNSTKTSGSIGTVQSDLLFFGDLSELLKLGGFGGYFRHRL